MADFYVWHASAQDDGDATWNSSTLAFLNLDLAFDTAGAGDTIHVAHDHNYSAYSANIIYSSAGTWADPVWVICENRTTGAYATTAIEDASGGAYDISLDGSAVSYGVNYVVGDDFTGGPNDDWLFQDCYIKLAGSGSKVIIGIAATMTWNNIDLKTGNANAVIDSDRGNFFWNGGSVIADAVAPTSLFSDPRGGSYIEVRGVDASAVTTNIVNNAGTIGNGAVVMKLLGIKVAVGVVFFEDTIVTTGTYIAQSADNGDAFYRFEEKSAEGNIVQDTANYLNATYDGTNGYSDKMVSNADPKTREWFRPLRFKLAEVWCATNPTLTIETITSNVTLQNDEFWIEIEYPNSTDEALRDWDRTSRLSAPSGTPANLTASAESWTEDLANEVKQKIAVTIGSGEEGIHTVWACLAKPSTTVYVDPKVTIS